jgi:hypothetical protein
MMRRQMSIWVALMAVSCTASDKPHSMSSTSLAAAPAERAPVAAEPAAGRSEADSEPAFEPGDHVALIAEGEGPDGGTGYQILIGTAAGPEGWSAELGGWTPATVACRVHVSSHLTMNVNKKNLTLGRKTTSLMADDQLEVRACDGPSSCRALRTGSVTLESFEYGQGAKGSYSFQGHDGVVEGSFDARWCGPASSAPKTSSGAQ